MEQAIQTKKNVTRRRLTYFFILVVGTAVLMNIYTVLYSGIYYFRYQSANRQIPVFRQYYSEIDQAVSSMDDYVVNEADRDYELAVAALKTAQESLSSLKSRVQDALITRELLDIEDMTAILEERMKDVNNAMVLYHTTGKEAFQDVTDSYENVMSVYRAIQDEYNPLSEMLLDSTEKIYQTMQKNSILGIGVFVTVFLVSGMLMFSQIKYIHRSISIPINELIRSAEEIQRGNFEGAVISLRENTIDEGMALLIRVFNKMTEQLKRQIETLQENARVQRQLQESRFKELQMQINPHFMFNTLNMIADFAYLENAGQTIVLLNKTAKIFRFSLDFSGKTVNLSREIEELKNYIYIQQQRFGKRIRFVFKIEEDVPDIKIPALILQPLVENSITHGVGMMTSNAEIAGELRHCQEEKKICIVIWDNGEGMSESKLEQVVSDMKSYSVQSAKIGLGNVYLRLKMFFKDCVMMEVKSTQGGGTAVAIEIAYDKEGKSCIDWRRDPETIRGFFGRREKKRLQNLPCFFVSDEKLRKRYFSGRDL